LRYDGALQPLDLDHLMPALHLPAPAKLNLMLHITGQRADGYHELQTLFQLLDRGDELEFSPTSNGCIRLPPLNCQRTGL